MSERWPQSTSLKQLDFIDLTTPVSRAEAKQFRRDPRNRQLWDAALLPENDLPAFVLRNALPLLLLLGFEIAVVVAALQIRPTTAAIVFGVIAVILLLPIKLFIDPLVRMISRGALWQRWIRLERFAKTNAAQCSVVVFSPPYAGSIFQRGAERRATDVVSFSTPRRIQTGNFRYDGELEIGRVREWGFIRLQLERNLPHMILESKTRHSLTRTRFPVAFSTNQTLSLEGDFGRYFRLHVPQHYERDALYVLTPDLMALLIDEGAPFDIEIVDNWMNIYSHRRFAMQMPETYARLDRIIETIGAKAIRQSARYWDDHTTERSQNLVAHPGRRLRIRANLIYVIGGGGIAVVVACALIVRAITGT